LADGTHVGRGRDEIARRRGGDNGAEGFHKRSQVIEERKDVFFCNKNRTRQINLRKIMEIETERQRLVRCFDWLNLYRRIWRPIFVGSQ
jgi:hypothetical protein